MFGQPRTEFNVKPCIVITWINSSGGICWVFFKCPAFCALYVIILYPLCLFAKDILHTRLCINDRIVKRGTVLSSLLHIFPITIQLKIKEIIHFGSYFKRQPLSLRRLIFMPWISCLYSTCPHSSSNKLTAWYPFNLSKDIWRNGEESEINLWYSQIYCQSCRC